MSKTNLLFTKDIDNKNILIDLENHNYQVMMEWEKPYMKALVNNLQPHGDVLEIGFGIGYSANQIQKYNITSHTIIECDPNVLKKLKAWSKKQKNKVHIVEGVWQDKLNGLNRFDSIFFDDSPIRDNLDLEETRVARFYYKVFERHVKKNARMTWYLSTPIYWICHPKTIWKIKEYKVEPPDHCKYFQDKVLYLPLLEFPYGSEKNLRKFILNKDFIFKEL